MVSRVINKMYNILHTLLWQISIYMFYGSVKEILLLKF
jgi:hypothetical protein